MDQQQDGPTDELREVMKRRLPSCDGEPPDGLNEHEWVPNASRGLYMHPRLAAFNHKIQALAGNTSRTTSDGPSNPGLFTVFKY